MDASSAVKSEALAKSGMGMSQQQHTLIEN